MATHGLQPQKAPPGKNKDPGQVNVTQKKTSQGRLGDRLENTSRKRPRKYKETLEAQSRREDHSAKDALPQAAMGRAARDPASWPAQNCRWPGVARRSHSLKYRVLPRQRARMGVLQARNLVTFPVPGPAVLRDTQERSLCAQDATSFRGTRGTMGTGARGRKRCHRACSLSGLKGATTRVRQAERPQPNGREDQSRVFKSETRPQRPLLCI